MFRIAICDDEKIFLAEEKRLVESYLDNNSIDYDVDVFLNGTDLLSAENSDQYDLIMLDVEMSGIDGMDVARQLRDKGVKTPIAFISAHMNYSTYGYHVSAIRFILKNEDIAIYINECLEHVLKNIGIDNRMIEIEFAFGKRQILVNEILYLKSRGNYTEFIMMNNEKHEQFQQKMPLKKVTEKLSHCDFISVSAKESVNLHHVKSVSRYIISLENGENLCISQKKYNDVMRAFTIFTRGRDL